MTTKRALIVYYSFTQQTRMQLDKFIAGLESAGVEVTQEQLEPTNPYAFPFRTNVHLAAAMIATFFQKRMPIKPVAECCFDSWDCIVLAGPTWSYNPSGPVLDFLDRYGAGVCGGKLVIPFISCRAYWQWHYWTIKRMLGRCGSMVGEPVVFIHPVREPWRSLGLLLKLRGKMAHQQYGWLRKHYPKYGHSEEQGLEAKDQGRNLGEKLLAAPGQED